MAVCPHPKVRDDINDYGGDVNRQPPTSLPDNKLSTFVEARTGDLSTSDANWLDSDWSTTAKNQAKAMVGVADTSPLCTFKVTQSDTTVTRLEYSLASSLTTAKQQAFDTAASGLSMTKRSSVANQDGLRLYFIPEP